MFNLNPPATPTHLKETLENLEELEKYLSETIAYHQAAIAQVETKRRAIAILLGTDTVAQLKDMPQVEKNTEVEIEVEDITQTPLDEATGAEAKVDIAISAEGNSLNNSESQATATIGQSASDPKLDLEKDETDWSQKEAVTVELKARAETTQLSLLEPEVQPSSVNQSDPAIPVEAILGAETESSLTTTPVNCEQSNRLDWTKELDFEQIAPRISTILAKESGIVVQIEVIIGRLFGELRDDQVKELKPSVRTLLIRGQKEKLWGKVPKAENGWTKDLSLLAEFKSQRADKQIYNLENKSEKSLDRNLLTEDKNIEALNLNAENLVETIRKILQSHAPSAININDIANLISEKQTKLKAGRCLRRAISDTLSNGTRKGYWMRSGPGFYYIENSSSTAESDSITSGNLSEIITEKIKQHGGLTQVVVAAMKNNYGRAMKVNDVINWLELKISDEDRKILIFKIANILANESKHKEKRWEKLEPGTYIFKEPNKKADLEKFDCKQIFSQLDSLVGQIPHSDRINGSISWAIATLLVEKSPQAIDAETIANWFYPTEKSASTFNAIKRKIILILSDPKAKKLWKKDNQNRYFAEELLKEEHKLKEEQDTRTIVKSLQESSESLASDNNKLAPFKENQLESTTTILEETKEDLFSKKSAQYGSLTKLVQAAMRDNPNTPIKSDRIIDWIDRNIPESSRPQLRARIGKILSKGFQSKHWNRLSTGVYLFEKPKSQTRKSFASANQQKLAITQGQDLVTAIEHQIKRLNWTDKELNTYLLQTYGVPSLLKLTAGDRSSFLEDLQVKEPLVEAEL